MSTPLVSSHTGVVFSQAALSGFPWSSPSSSQTRDGIAHIGPVLRFARDSEIYAEGAETTSLYKVVSGVVRTCKFLNDGRRQIDAFHLAGDMFGFEAHGEHRLSA